jgi:redox-sensitive bicupin YhaK (pirin superfamily)
MNTVLHKANTRGHNSFGWLNSFHSFNFGHYYNPERMHFGALRVLNDDTVAAGMGFGKHPHDNMEIVSIPLSGDLHHQDSTGRNEIIRQHDVQIMSAGSGIAHSEMNANKDQQVKFLQIWVMPKGLNITPRYEQKSFKPEDRANQILTVVAPDNKDAVWINQDAWFSLANFEAGKNDEYFFSKSHSLC